MHTICTATPDQEWSYFQNLLGFLLDPEPDLGSKVRQLFEEETDDFGLSIAFLSRIDLESETERFEVVHGPAENLRDGDTVPLSVTYCRKTIADPDGTLAVSDALAEGWEGDPAYERFGFGSYVGTTVTLEDRLYGTICFADTEPRSDPITDRELVLLEIFGRWVTYELNQWTGPPTDEPNQYDVVEAETPISPDLDSMMDALGKPARRLILLKLQEDTAENGSLVLDRSSGIDASLIELHHLHLPKLNDAGYIEWDPNTNVVSRGPNFDDFELLLRLLNVYIDEFYD